MLLALNNCKGGQWRIVAARQSHGKSFIRDETAKHGAKLRTNYKWCFAKGAVTHSAKTVKKILSL
jgi:hypothetical protein